MCHRHHDFVIMSAGEGIPSLSCQSGQEIGGVYYCDPFYYCDRFQTLFLRFHRTAVLVGVLAAEHVVQDAGQGIDIVAEADWSFFL